MVVSFDFFLLLLTQYYSRAHIFFLKQKKKKKKTKKGLGPPATVTSILRRLPKQRRTGMFSATQTGEVLDLVRAGMRNAVRVQVRLEIAQPAAAAPRAEGDDGDGDDADQLRVAQAQSLAPGATTPASLRNYYVACPQGERVARLALFLKRRIADGHKVMVFFLTCAAVEYFGKVLPDLPELAGATVLSIHGKQDQRKRKANYDAYVTQRPAVLFATDVAARGLDVPDIDWIAQFDPPQDPASFVHRAGRAGRMGREGASVVFLAEEELPYVDYVRIKGIPIVSLADRDAGIDPEGTDVDATGAAIRDTIRTKIARDRDIYDRSHLAFVSHTRGYKEHRLEYIFALRSLRLGHLASSWGLIDLPSMPEIKLLAAKRAKEQKRLRRAGLISDEEDEGAGEGAAAQEAQREGGRRAASVYTDCRVVVLDFVLFCLFVCFFLFRVWFCWFFGASC
jgi:ATP-dependent RNA helicase DDX55/SPB4